MASNRHRLLAISRFKTKQIDDRMWSLILNYPVNGKNGRNLGVQQTSENKK